jgi:hypothetical protein
MHEGRLESFAANHRLGDLLVLLLEEVVGSWASVGISNEAVVNAKSKIFLWKC